eukprot:m.147508 g.147508  ORF g.147508 m.147508 type:complete len:353 (+) comp9708_c1_seq6:2312-3370(+)
MQAPRPRSTPPSPACRADVLLARIAAMADTFQDAISFRLQHSVSHMASNLSVLCPTPGKRMFAFAHDSKACITVIEGLLKKAAPSHLLVNDSQGSGVRAPYISQACHRHERGSVQVSWCVATSQYLVLLAAQSIQFFDVAGALLFEHKLPDHVEFARGIAAVGHKSVAVGLSTGEILVFNPANPIAPLEYTLTGPASPVSDLASNPSLTRLASSHENGALMVWDPAARKTQWIVAQEGALCMAAACTDALLCCGLVSGVVQIYSFETQTLLASISAHARSVYALALDGHGLLASVGEDSRVCVWTLPTAAQAPELRFSVTISGRMPTGAVFAGQDLCVACYDTERLFVFERV